jgi:PAS domain S-box-containing protein
MTDTTTTCPCNNYQRTRHSEIMFTTLDYHDLLFADSDTAQATLDKDGKFLSVNEIFCNMLGYTEEELKNLSFGDVSVQDQNLKNDYLNVHALLKGKAKMYSLKKSYWSKSRKLINVELTVARVPYHDLSMPLEHFVVKCKPLTEFNVKESIDGTMRKTFGENLREWKMPITVATLLTILFSFIAGKGTELLTSLVDLIKAFSM